MRRLGPTAVLFSIWVSCGGQAATAPGPTQSSGAGAPACGLALDSSWAPACQARADLGCCEEQKACAASPTCAAVVRCISAQPRPRDSHTAITSCLPQGPATPDTTAGLKRFGELENCPNRSNLPYPAGHTCEWPTGDGS